MKTTSNICLNNTEYCGNKILARGLCIVCYHKAINSVRMGKTTWNQLVRENKALAKSYQNITNEKVH